MKSIETSELPFQGALRPYYVLSVIIAILMVITSLIGLAYPETAYPEDVLVQSFVPNDVVTLFVGLPVLIISVWLTRLGKLTGLLCLPGALLYVFYNYLSYVFALPVNWAFCLDLLLVVLSIYMLIGLISAVDLAEVRTRLSGRVGEKFSGGLLMGLGLLIIARVIVLFLGEIADGESLSKTELAVSLADSLIAPAYFIGGLLLWRRHALGYAAGLGLLFQASMLFIALVALILIQPILTEAPFAWVDGLIVLAMGLITFIPFGRFWLGAARAN